MTEQAKANIHRSNTTDEGHTGASSLSALGDLDHIPDDPEYIFDVIMIMEDMKRNNRSRKEDSKTKILKDITLEDVHITVGEAKLMSMIEMVPEVIVNLTDYITKTTEHVQLLEDTEYGKAIDNELEFNKLKSEKTTADATNILLSTIKPGNL